MKAFHLSGKVWEGVSLLPEGSIVPYNYPGRSYWGQSLISKPPSAYGVNTPPCYNILLRVECPGRISQVFIAQSPSTIRSGTVFILPNHYTAFRLFVCLFLFCFFSSLYQPVFIYTFKIHNSCTTPNNKHSGRREKTGGVVSYDWHSALNRAPYCFT